MELNLTKGERVDLTKTHPGLDVIHVAAGWDVSRAGDSYDLDIALALLGADKNLVNDGLIYFNHKSGYGIQHGGDNLTGVGDGDDETIKMSLAALPADVQFVAVIINIFNAASKGNQHFGKVDNAFVRVYDPAKPVAEQNLLKYDLTEDYTGRNGIVVGKFYRHGEEWKFQALGAPSDGQLNVICESLGTIV